MDHTRVKLLSALESTLLSPTASSREVAALCEEAALKAFGGVCVAPCRVRLAAGILKGSQVRVVSVAGFPLGFERAESKVREIAELISDGAHEVDVVINQGYVLEESWGEVEAEVAGCREASRGSILKIILETGRLDPARLARAATLCVEGGADYLKTSTGLGPRGATVEDVHFLKKIAGARAGVKAAGGIKTLRDARAMTEAGADRIGTSSAGAIASSLTG